MHITKINDSNTNDEYNNCEKGIDNNSDDDEVNSDRNYIMIIYNDWGKNNCYNTVIMKTLGLMIITIILFITKIAKVMLTTV